MSRITRRGTPDVPADSVDHEADSRSEAIFLRGLSLGALIGAAIAGSAIWERRRARQVARPAAASEALHGPTAENEPGAKD